MMFGNTTFLSFAFLSAVLMSVSVAEKIEFSHTLIPKNTICFLEQIGEGNQGKLKWYNLNLLHFPLLAIVEVTSELPTLTLTINDPKGKNLVTLVRKTHSC